MLVFDLDGTLLHDDKSLSDYTVDILEKCRSKGMKVAIATARPLRSVSEYSMRIKPDYTICHNGAVISGKEGLLYSSIKRADIEQILQALKALPGNNRIAIESNDKMIANFSPGEVWKEEDYEKSEFEEIMVDHADKILFFLDENDSAEEIQSSIPEECYLVVIEKNFGMIMNKKATKYQAVKKIIEKEGIRLESVFFFGDDYNDIELLEKAGYGVAVANACPAAKQAAGYLCGTNNEDGVAVWLAENLKL